MAMHVATRQQRVTWLVGHPELWRGWEGTWDRRAAMIVEAMKRDGMVSGTTSWVEVDVTGLIDEARARLSDAAS